MYVLLNRVDADRSWSAYIGMATDLRSRLGHHVRNRPDWYRAVVTRRDTSTGFTSTQAGWLEGRLYEVMKAARPVRLLNANIPGDETLPAREKRDLEMIVEPVRCVLRLLGHILEARDPVPEPPSPPVPEPPRQRVGNLAGLVEAELLEPGSRLVPVEPRWSGVGRVTSDGWIEVGGKSYYSPSGAAKAVTGRVAESGWDFWAVATADGTTLNKLRSDHKPGTGTPASPSPPRAQGKLFGLIEAGLLEPGAVLVPADARWSGEGRVTQDGWIEVDGKPFASPSPAGQAIKGGNAPNGWTFWAVGNAEGDTLADLRTQARTGAYSPRVLPGT